MAAALSTLSVSCSKDKLELTERQTEQTDKKDTENTGRNDSGEDNGNASDDKNGNKKYCNLDTSMSASPVSVGNIESGDLML